MRTVCFLGLCQEEVANLKESALRNWGVDAIWTINNWYYRSKIEKPDRIFQCHPAMIDQRDPWLAAHLRALAGGHSRPAVDVPKGYQELVNQAWAEVG